MAVTQDHRRFAQLQRISTGMVPVFMHQCKNARDDRRVKYFSLCRGFPVGQLLEPFVGQGKPTRVKVSEHDPGLDILDPAGPQDRPLHASQLIKQREQGWTDVPVWDRHLYRSHGRTGSRSSKVVMIEADVHFPHAAQITRRPLCLAAGRRV